MMALIVLVVLALIALMIVSAINRKQAQDDARRMAQRKLRIQVEALVDVANGLEQTVPNYQIVKYINDEILGLLQQILALETGPKNHIESSIRHAMIRSEDLAQGKGYANATYQKNSDAQIAQTQVQLSEAVKILRHMCAQGKLTDTDLETFTNELSWAFLMVSVASFIAQGYKFSALGDRFSAQNFYQKAQGLLMESTHADPRRTRMIRELSEIVEGSRKTISRDLLPERPLPD